MISSFFSRASREPNSVSTRTEVPLQRLDDPQVGTNVAQTDAGARVGAENETVRALLIELTHHLGAADDLKQSFHNLLSPLNSVLGDLEQERAEKAQTHGALAALRTAHETLRGDFEGLERRSSVVDEENGRLRLDLEAAVLHVQTLEEARSQLNGELASGRAAQAMIEKQLAAESGQVQMLSEENKHLSDCAAASDNR